MDIFGCRSAGLNEKGEHCLRRARRAEARYFGYNKNDRNHSSTLAMAIGEKRRRRETLPDFIRRIPRERLRPFLRLPLVKAAKVSEVKWSNNLTYIIMILD